MHSRPFVVSIVCSLLLFTAGAARAQTEDTAEPSESPPHYRFGIGQKLTYESFSEFDYGSGSFITAVTWDFWVVRPNPDGSWRLIVRDSDNSPGREPKATIGYFDLFPDGEIVWNNSLSFQLDPGNVFVRLPKTGEEMHNGWRTVNQPLELTRLHKVRHPAEDTGVVIEVERKRPLDDIYVSTSRSVVYFDGVQGLVTKIESENTQGYGFNGKGTGLLELSSVEVIDDDELRNLVADSEAYSGDAEQYNALVEQARRNSERTDELLTEAGAIWESTGDRYQTDLFRNQARDCAGRHASSVEWIKERAEWRAGLLGQTSPEWETVDFEGNPHSPASHRGEVVVLDFWYRGCGWCIRAMPQVNRLSERFANEPVVVLGMNTDSGEEDALLVIDKMNLRYPNLKAEGLPEKYEVRGFPTLIVLDQEGRIHDLYVGYSPTLFEEAEASIAQLLEHPPE